MELLYMGTAAFEGIPSMFCSCENCKRARKNGGKDLRTRTQALVDDRLLIDFPNDAFAHFLQYDLDFEKIHHLLITHSHSDHLVPSDLNIRGEGFAVPNGKEPLHVYVGESGRKMIENACGGLLESGRLVLHELKAWESFVADGYTVTPVPASHDPNSSPFVFVIEKDGKCLFYANDTGVLPDDTYEKMKQKGISFDFVSADCTMMTLSHYYGHYNLQEVAELKTFLAKNGLLKENCKFCITHFSHHGYVSYEHVKELAEKEGFDVSYDGMKVEF